MPTHQPDRARTFGTALPGPEAPITAASAGPPPIASSAARVSAKQTAWSRATNAWAVSPGSSRSGAPNAIASGPRRTDSGMPAIFSPWTSSGEGGDDPLGPGQSERYDGQGQRLRQVGHPGAEPHGPVVGELRLGRGVGALREDQDTAARRLCRARERTQAHLSPQVLVDRVQPEHQDAHPGPRPGHARLCRVRRDQSPEQAAAP